MKKETAFWLVIMLLGGVFLLWRAGFSEKGMGKSYVKVEHKQFVNVGTDTDPNWMPYNSPDLLDYELGAADFDALPADRKIDWTVYEPAQQIDYVRAETADANQTTYQLSMSSTLGIWIAAFFTLAIFSFLYRDNPFYKIAESVVVGVSAAYWMVVGFWDVLVPNLIARLMPNMVHDWAMPGLSGGDLNVDLVYLIPLVLGILLLMRLSPKGAWIARWPLAFIIGTTAGIRLTGFIHADFLSQIRNSIVPLYAEAAQRAADGTPVLDASGDPVMSFTLWGSVSNLILVVGVLACLVYFFFSFEHKGVVGHAARLGIWFLMITFGAAFGYTVMGRIALLAIRIEFLVDDWLWIIDPTGKRAADAVALLSAMGIT